MAVVDYVKQYGVLIVGLMIGGGFAFGGIASYSGIAGGNQQPSNQQGQENSFNPVAPNKTVGNGSFNLSVREQSAVGYRQNSVFVNLLYENSTQRQQLNRFKELSSEFEGTVYVRTVKWTESEIATSYALVGSDMPTVIIIGGNTGYNSPALSSPTNEEIRESVCEAARSYGEFPSCVV